MNAHTPGPWHFGHEDLRGGRYWVVTIPGIGDSIDLHEDDNGEANCRLIAAAPDMVTAGVEIDRLLLVIESAVRNCDPKRHVAVLAALKANRAAITKATAAAS